MNHRLTRTIRITAAAGILLSLAALAGSRWQLAQAAPPAQSTPQATPAREEATPPAPAADWEDDESFGDEEAWQYESAAVLLGLTLDELYTALDQGPSIAELAQAQGMDPQTIINQLVEEENAFIAELETAGDITAAEAAEWRAEVVPYITYVVHEKYIDPYVLAAQFLGMAEEDLWAALEEGQSLAALVTAHGLEPQQLIDTLSAAENAQVAQLLAAGLLTEAEAAEWQADIAEYVPELVHETWAEGDWADFECEGEEAPPPPDEEATDTPTESRLNPGLFTTLA